MFDQHTNIPESQQSELDVHDPPGWTQPPPPPPPPAGGEGEGGGGCQVKVGQQLRQSGFCSGDPDIMGQPVPDGVLQMTTDHALQSRGTSQLGTTRSAALPGMARKAGHTELMAE